MARQPHWFDPPYAGDFFGSLLDAVIEVTRTTPKKEPPKPPPRDTAQKKDTA
jgi:hypothetical protein